MSFVVKAVKSVVKAVVGVVTGVVKAIGSVVSAVINFVASPFMGLFGVPDVPSDTGESQRQQGILVQQQGSNVDIPVVYGYRKLAGAVVYAETGSTNNQYLWVAYVFAEGLVEGLREVFIDDNQLPNTIVANLNAGQVVTIAEGKYNGRVKLQWYPGVLFSNPASTTIAANSILKEAPSWKTTNHFNGLAVLFARYEWKQIVTQADSDNNPFGGGIPSVQIGLLGKRIASLTIASPDAYTYATAPVRYSTNPAEIVLDYLRNPYYGKGLSNDEIDWDSFKKAAAKCNQTVEYIAGVSGPILTTNYVVDTGQSLFNNVKILLTNMRGYLPYIQGKYKLKIEDAGNETDIQSGVATIAQTFTKDNIVGDITYTGIERSAKYSQVVVSYVDPDQKWSVQQVVYPETEAERLVYVGRDGGRENKAEITFPGCTNYAIAKDFAKLILNKSRYQESCSFRADSSAFELEPGDNIYIASNVLNFGTDPNAGAIPWRIVSIKLNNDYTFDIGCVRNPDFLYPRTRVGEVDYVLPPYVPKGAEIYYPGIVTGQVPIGLVPPTNAVLPESGSTNTTTNPTTTVPSTDGGGNGGTTNNTTTNTSPTPAPVTTATVNHVIKIDKASYVVENGQIYGLLEFTQPDTSQYSGVLMYYKRNIASETVWKLYEVNDVPGIGQKITAKIGPLIAGTYLLKTRVKYSTQQQSTLAGTFNLNVAANTNENPTDYAETVGSGWAPNTTPLPNSRITTISTITGAPILSGSQPTNPRTMSVTIKQDILNYPINGYVDGMKIYYKSSSASYWKESTFQFVQPYNEGVSQTFTLPFTLGVPAYPGAPGTADDYDFIFRFKYTDGTESTKQLRIMAVPVETGAFGEYSYNPFILKTNVLENTTAYDFVTEANAPPGSVVDTRTMTVGITAVSNSVSLPAKIIFAITPPNAANLPSWYGCRVYFRAVQPGQNPAFTSIDITPLPSDVTGKYISIPTVYDEVREYVIVPLVDYSGTKTEASKAWFGSGYVHNRETSADYPSTRNWLQSFNLQLLDTNVALNKISSSFPQTDPTIMVQSWALVQQDNNGLDASKTYYELVFSHQHITSYNEITIYRRNILNGTVGTGTTSALYYGLGRWEKVVVTTTNNTGTVTVNLRNAISYTEFDSYFGINAGTTLISPLYPTNKPLAGGNTTSSTEFLVVVKAAGTVSTKALRLPPINRYPLTLRVDGLNPNKPTTVTVSDYNTYTNGYLRRISEAVTPFSNTVLVTSTSRTPNYTAPTPTTGPSVV